MIRFDPCRQKSTRMQPLSYFVRVVNDSLWPTRSSIDSRNNNSSVCVFVPSPTQALIAPGETCAKVSCIHRRVLHENEMAAGPPGYLRRHISFRGPPSKGTQHQAPPPPRAADDRGVQRRYVSTKSWRRWARRRVRCWQQWFRRKTRRREKEKKQQGWRRRRRRGMKEASSPLGPWPVATANVMFKTESISMVCPWMHLNAAVQSALNFRQ